MESQSPVPPHANASPSRSCSVMAIVNFVLRTLACILLLIALIVLTTASVKVIAEDEYGEIYVSIAHFNYFYAYRYTLYTILIGLVYTLLQTALAIFRLATGRLISPVLLQFDFYADKFISYTLATGAAAAFGLTVEIRRTSDGGSSFWDKTDASASLVLLGFVCTAVSSVFSSLALSKYKY